MSLTDTTAVTAALLRPLTAFETEQLPELIAQAENALKTRRRNLDDRIAAFDAGDTDWGIDKAAVRRVLANVIARKMTNPVGAASITNSRTDGEFSTSASTSYASYGRAVGAGTPGELEITAADIEAIDPPMTSVPRTIRVGPPAPWTGAGVLDAEDQGGGIGFL